MRKKSLHRMNLASSSSACIKRSSRQKSAILSKLSSESGLRAASNAHTTFAPFAVCRSI